MGTHQYNFDEKFEFAGKAKTFSLIAIIIGVLAVAYGFMSGHAERTFANLLLMSYYFACVCIAGTFFLGVQYMAQAGWSASFLRVPQAMARTVPVAAFILLVVIVAGLFSHNLYHHWNQEGISDPNSPNFDKLISLKSGYLNIPFFLTRIVIFLGIYSIFSIAFVKASQKEDEIGGLSTFKTWYGKSAMFLALLGFTQPIFAFDAIMSLEAHWFSTMFGWYNFAAMWVCGLSLITIIIVCLRKVGYMKWVTPSQLHDLGKFMFAFSIFWTYVWFCQFLLIYYANIGEETVYFYKRMEGYSFWLLLSILLNFVSPVLLLMSRDAKRQENMLLAVGLLILVGHWVDYYQMVMPGTVEFNNGFGVLELGVAAGFAGLFIFLVMNNLSKTRLIPKNHPLLQESLHHEIL